MPLHRRYSNIFCIIIQYKISLTLCKHPARHWATVSGEAFIKSSSANTKSCTAAAVVPRNSSRSSRTGDRATAARASNPQETVMVFASDRWSSKTKLYKNPISLRPTTEIRTEHDISRFLPLLLLENVQIKFYVTNQQRWYR